MTARKRCDRPYGQHRNLNYQTPLSLPVIFCPTTAAVASQGSKPKPRAVMQFQFAQQTSKLRTVKPRRLRHDGNTQETPAK